MRLPLSTDISIAFVIMQVLFVEISWMQLPITCRRHYLTVDFLLLQSLCSFLSITSFVARPKWKKIASRIFSFRFSSPSPVLPPPATDTSETPCWVLALQHEFTYPSSCVSTAQPYQHANHAITYGMSKEGN